jgi:hypothetical protein
MDGKKNTSTSLPIVGKGEEGLICAYWVTVQGEMGCGKVVVL